MYDGTYLRLFGDSTTRYALVCFWDTWSSLSRKQVRTLDSVNRSLASNMVRVVGAPLAGRGRSDVASYLTEEAIILPCMKVDAQWDTLTIGIVVVPTTVLIDSHGSILQKVFGYRDQQYWTCLIAELSSRDNAHGNIPSYSQLGLGSPN